ncbi:hypothetical protein EJ06DRAFT_582708 [Trichodelitschia bisporula]|uniref:Uncharacterized protein n=1 Tax=Trichodelitschia bisporula TaxID=703511 RepID=A0A6G1HU38_9PEZI|nr:hypothetical protein EJ06DRAFT_582708 [Trichodelitschia bisporula]
MSHLLRPAGFLAGPAPLRTLTWASTRHVSTEKLPRVVQPSLWTSLIPKALRRSTPTPHTPRPSMLRNFLSNPYSTIILLGMLVGSQAINTLQLRNDTVAYTRAADAKIWLLRETIGRVMRGEEVDVGRALGAGDPVGEREWAEVLGYVEADQSVQSRKRRRAARKAGEEGIARDVERTLEDLDPEKVQVQTGGEKTRPARFL